MNANDAPSSVETVVLKHGGHGLQCVMTKTVSKSDIDHKQLRLLIPKADVCGNLLPALFEEERLVANLVDGTSSSEGLEVNTYLINDFCFYPTIIRWNSSGGTVLNGGEWGKLLAFANLRKDDEIKMWCFRDRQQKLCFILSKTANEDNNYLLP